MKSFGTILILLLMLSPNLQAQDGATQKSPLEIARLEIKDLKNGVLLVRLPTKSKVITALRAADKSTQAAQIESKNRADNLKLVQAVRSNFKFCPVAFFYSDDSRFIMKQELDSVGFLNDSLIVDPSITVNQEHVFTAEVTLIEQNLDEKYRSTTNTEAEDVDSRNEAKYYGGTNMRFQAFIIKDHKFRQLQRPFPYYSRTLNSFFLKKKLSEVVRVMDDKLNKFYAIQGQ